MTASLEAPCPPRRLFAAVEDLGRYPAWLSIVPKADPAPAAPGDAGPAWSVELRGRIGPLARSKRLRMVRTVHEAPGRVRFERRELDGRRHAAWVLEARVAADGAVSRLEMDLHYGGSFGGSVLERLLSEEIDQGRSRLLAHLAAVDPA
ncbi:SRPBCC family protein [Rhabdothermincola sp.]|uniref:SRPBCC family protein n=1 Tax=Rhabdothermincola sp. TaxID=2820405 RepID=UPI002FE11B69